jgi:hypothetical protein
MNPRKATLQTLYRLTDSACKGHFNIHLFFDIKKFKKHEPFTLSNKKNPLSTKIIPPSTIFPIGSMHEIAKLNHPFCAVSQKNP